MKTLRKARLAAGIGMALAGGAVIPYAGAVNLSVDGTGSVAIAPFYTVRNDFQTAINLTNTTDVPILVKVRFHEGHNSRDVLDFNVAMSAFDVFTGVVRADMNGQAEFVNTDSPNDSGRYTCTIPNTRTVDPVLGEGHGDALPVRLNPLGFSGSSICNDNAPEEPTICTNDDTGLGGDNAPLNPPDQPAIDRLAEGYIEFIVMGHADGDLAESSAPIVFPSGDDLETLLEVADTDLAGQINIARAIEQHDCERVNDALGIVDPESRRIAAARQFGQPIDALTFTFALINPQEGIAAGSPSTTWANFYAPANGSGMGNFVEPDGFVFPSDNYLCDIPRGAEHPTAAEPANWCPDGSSGNDCADAAELDGAATANGTESCRNLVTMQDFSEFLEPTLNDAFPVQANWWDDRYDTAVSAVPVYVNEDLPTVEQQRGVDAVSLTIQRQRAYNQWSNNEQLGAATEWIITQPTKAFYVDQGRGIQFQVPTGDGAGEGALPRNEAYVSSPIDGSVPYLPYQEAFSSPGAPRTNSRACNLVAFSLFDRAEQSPAAAPPGEPPFSPAPPPESDPRALCYETTVLTFGEQVLGGAPQGALNRLDISDLIEDLQEQFGNTAGWASLVLGPTVDADGALMMSDTFMGAYLLADVGGDALPEGGDAYTGLPVIGFTLSTLNFPARPDLSFGSAVSHSFDRILADILPDEG